MEPTDGNEAKQEREHIKVQKKTAKLYTNAWEILNKRNRDEGDINRIEKPLKEVVDNHIEDLHKEIAKLRDGELRQKLMDMSAQLAIAEIKAFIAADQAAELRKLFNDRNAKNKRARLQQLMRSVELLVKGI